MCCSLNSLLLGIAVFKTTCEYVSKNSYVMYLPTVSTLLSVVWFFIWILSAVFIFSIGEPKPREDFPMITEIEWTTSSRWMVAYHLFALLWVNEFIYSSVQFIIGASTCIWYFDSSSDTKGDVKRSVQTAASWLMKFHWSSVALGSMIIAMCETIRYIFEYYRKKMGAVDKALPCIKILFCLTGYCLFILEECIKYISKNAYIQIALTNKSFCPGAFDAFVLMVKNIGRFAIAGGIGRVYMFFGTILISAFTCCFGFFLLTTVESV